MGSASAFTVHNDAPRYRANGSAHAEPWGTPDASLLGTGRRPAPDFPTDLLGPFWADWTTKAAAGASAPVDYVAAALLASVGAILANVRRPSAGASWEEPPVMWMAVVGPPSSAKSPAVDRVATGLIRPAEDKMAEGYDDARRDYETAKQVSKAKRELWEKEVSAALKNGGGAPTLPDAACDPEEPVRPRIRVADITTEKLGFLASRLPRGLFLIRDELAGWFGAFDRYGGGGSDRAFALEMYGGRSYVVDRMRSPDPVHIRHLSCSILGGTQPDKLAAIIDTPDDGLICRFLWCWPDQTPQFQLARDVTNDEAAREAFGRLCGLGMSSSITGEPEPRRVPLSEAAMDVLQEFGQDMRTVAVDATGPMGGAMGKARGHCLRLACILEYLHWSGDTWGAEPPRITDKSVGDAALLLETYFLPMAARAFGDAAIPVGERRAMTLARQIKRRRLSTFNARELRREIGGDLREAANMDAACAVLMEAEIIRPVFARTGASYGRPAKAFDVNPAILEPAQ